MQFRRLPLLLTLLCSLLVAAHAQSVPVLMLSDIHLDPFRDPAKFAALSTSPATAWPKILNAPDSVTQAADFEKLTTTCPSRGLDTDWPLLEASLKASHQQIPHPAFITVSGDLMAHVFDCRYRALGGKPELYPAFAAKTVAVVAAELKRTFPKTPIYVALGNNDSGCGDYREDAGSKFLVANSTTLADLTRSNKRKIATESSRLGDWSVTLPEPFQNARLLVLQDMFELKNGVGCDGKRDFHAEEEQISWLREQLESVQKHHQQAWVMAHVPPGVDSYATLSHGIDVCSGKPPIMFTANDELAKTLVEYADVVRLALFAHTHMDEMHVIGHGDHTVAIRMVPSISPVNGNHPAFTVSEVDPKSFTLRDWTVYVAPNKNGTGVWSEEYRFSQTYHEPAFDAVSARKLLDGFRADKGSEAASTQAYEHNFFAGDSGKFALVMRFGWPMYSCAANATTADEYKSCVCPAK